MEYRKGRRFRRSVSARSAAWLATTTAAIMCSHPASATVNGPSIGDPYKSFVWCLGDQGPHPTIPGYPATTASNPADTWDAWESIAILKNKQTSDPLLGFGYTAETPAKAAPNQNDRYAIQLNYWNSVANSGTQNPSAPFGYSTGQSCMVVYLNNYMDSMTSGDFTITYPADPPKPRDAEKTWAAANPSSFPWYGKAPYTDGPTQGGPTGYVSTFKGCSWDKNSCTDGSKVALSPGAVTKTADTNVFPEKLTDITSIPTQWTIAYDNLYGAPGTKDKTKQAWDASYDIWFDTDADTGNGKAPYGNARGQNDGLEIMVWMNHNGSYVDAAATGSWPAENPPGYIQPTGHIRERVVINGVLYDVWVGRLNNPYFSRTTGTVIPQTAEPSTCPTLAVNGGPGTTCGTEWNVVSFVATKDSNGTDYRAMNMSLDAKVFADYILGKQDGLWKAYGTATDGSTRAANSVLKCPASAMNQELNATTGDCLNPNWYLMSIQAGFETWIGGNGLSSTDFKAHVSTNSTGIQTGLVNDQGNPIIHWATPFDVIYSGCSAYDAANKASFTITGFNADTGAAMTYPASGVPIDMGPQDPNTKQFTYLVSDWMYPMHGDAQIHFTSACGNVDATVFIDPSGKVFYNDGKTPVSGATVTLLRSASGAAGPYASVPNHNYGLSPPVMQPNDNTENSMLSTSIGSYAWNVSPGWYEVRASLAGCGTVTTTPQQVTPTHAVENLNITLPCAPPKALPTPPVGGGTTPGVTVKLTDNGTQANSRYCKNLVVTNNNNYAVDWKVQFNLPYSGYIDPVASGHWNFNFTASGNTITAWGVDWNKTLAAKATSNSIGFCAFKK
jgi:cellulose binding protein with CBM2 domain